MDIITPLLMAFTQGTKENGNGTFTTTDWQGNRTTYADGPGALPGFPTANDPASQSYYHGTTGINGPVNPFNPKGNGAKIVPLVPGGGFHVRPGTPPPLDTVKAPYAPPLPAGSGRVAGGWGPPQDPAGNAYNPTIDGLNAVSGIFGGTPADLGNGVKVAAGAGADALGLGAFGETITNDINAAKLSASNSLKVIGVELLFLVVFVVCVVIFLSQTDAGQTIVETTKQVGKDAATAAVLA